ncbi:hypothetical protein [Pseudoroseomonas cervicalis]|uniref:hypothetical protein n=1 Tax=Teichococcus cervicalis TaxID=204525 RepID=UPI002787C957|nr:hypothetical protein [Pseudoroseomonas cervicalis]MDQ1079675.1 hypothetical protein [Pseudoroseomonas cervicalis]
MAHNLSEIRRRARLMEEPLEMWRHCLVYMRCAAKHPACRMWVSDLLDRPDPLRKVGDLLTRLTCKECNQPPHAVGFRAGPDSPHWQEVIMPDDWGRGYHEPSTVRVEWWRDMKL